MHFTGAYAPLTTEGRIIVDGVLVSCYAECPHDLAHLTQKPMLKYAEVIEWIFGDEFGFPLYLATARRLSQLILPDGQY